MPIATSKRRQNRLSVSGVLTISLLVAFVLLVVVVAVFGMDQMMEIVHSTMNQVGM